MSAVTATGAPARPEKPWYEVLYIQVLIAILLGVVVGWLWPQLATNDWIKALGDGFIKLIRMVIAPIIFCTVVSGIAHIQDARKVGRVGIKALAYFEALTWPNGPFCPHCGETQRIYRLEGKSTRPGLIHCNACDGSFGDVRTSQGS